MPLTDESASSSSLLPIPDGSVFNDGQSIEAYRARKERELAKGYNGNGGGTALAMAVRLLPTPGASDDHGGEGPTRLARQQDGKTGGATLKDIGHLLPTPTGQDASNTAGPSQSERNTPPLNTVVTELLPTPVRGDADGSRSSKGSARPDEMGLAGTVKMLPTPQASDGSGGPLRDEETLRTGKRPSGQPATVTLVTAARQLLPTPTSGDHKSTRNQTGDERGWERGDRHAGTTLTDATPTGQDARQNALNETEAQRNPATMWATMGRVQSGDHTSPRFGGGKPSSADPHPDQLTLEDA